MTTTSVREGFLEGDAERKKDKIKCGKSETRSFRQKRRERERKKRRKKRIRKRQMSSKRGRTRL